jgi:hypothetical protein
VKNFFDCATVYALTAVELLGGQSVLESGIP